MLHAVFIAEHDAARPTGYTEVSIRKFADGRESMPIPHLEGWYVDPSARRKIAESAPAEPERFPEQRLCFCAEFVRVRPQGRTHTYIMS
jgi:hypothetical protein